MSDKQKGYLGNPNLKETGLEMSFTKAQVKEYMKCAGDPIYFTKKYVKVVSLDKGLIPFDLYDYQKEVENNWIKNLRETNSIVLNPKALRKLKKMYK